MSADSHVHDHPPIRPLTRLREMLGPDARDIRMVIWFSIFIALLSLVTPIAIQSLVETVQFGVLLWPIVALALVMFGCLLFAALIRICETYVVEYLQQRLFLRALSRFAHCLPRIKLESLEGKYGPEIVNRFFDVMSVQKSTAALLLDGIEIVIATLVGMTVLAFYHPILLAFDIGLIFFLIILVLLGRKAVTTSIDESHMKYEVAGWLQEVARLLRTFRTGSGMRMVRHKANELGEGYLEARRKHFRIVFRQTIFALLLQVVASTLLLGVGGFLVVQGQLTWGQLVAAELIVALTVSSLSKVGKYFENYYDLLTGVEKLAQVTDLPLEREGGEPLPAQDHGMRLHVRLQEFDAGHVSIREVQWEIEPNEKIALVGPAGSGKSVLLDILSGFREAKDGQLQLDGHDLRDIDLASVREQVAIVRDVEIFAGTIEENLRLGREAIPLSDLRQALETVKLENAVYTLPMALKTILSPTGSPLSESQSIRLCIARALLGRPRLLILDGILDRIDLEYTPDLIEVLFGDAAPWTLLLASRDPDVIRRCDRSVSTIDDFEPPFGQRPNEFSQ